MSSSPSSRGGERYYEPAEVEAYIHDAGVAIAQLQEQLHEALRRAEAAEQLLSGDATETASLGRALVLASEVADKTIAEADQRAAEILARAEGDAKGSIISARQEADRIVEAARQAAAELSRQGEVRLLSTVDKFVQHSQQLRQELGFVEREMATWRRNLSVGTPDATVDGDPRLQPPSAFAYPPPPRVPYGPEQAGERAPGGSDGSAESAGTWAPHDRPPFQVPGNSRPPEGTRVPHRDSPVGNNQYPSQDFGSEPPNSTAHK